MEERAGQNQEGHRGHGLYHKWWMPLIVVARQVTREEMVKRKNPIKKIFVLTQKGIKEIKK